MNRSDELDLLEYAGRILKRHGGGLSLKALGDELLNRHGCFIELPALGALLAESWSMFLRDANDLWHLIDVDFDSPAKVGFIFG